MTTMGLTRFITLTFFVYFCLHQGIVYGRTNITCYYCINDCDLPLNTLYCELLDNNISCYSSLSTSQDGTTEHLKGCAIDEDTDFQDYCYTVDTGGGSCYTCQEDL